MKFYIMACTKFSAFLVNTNYSNSLFFIGQHSQILRNNSNQPITVVFRSGQNSENVEGERLFNQYKVYFMGLAIVLAFYVGQIKSNLNLRSEERLDAPKV